MQIRIGYIPAFHSGPGHPTRPWNPQRHINRPVLIEHVDFIIIEYRSRRRSYIVHRSCSTPWHKTFYVWRSRSSRVHISVFTFTLSYLARRWRLTRPLHRASRQRRPKSSQTWVYNTGNDYRSVAFKEDTALSEPVNPDQWRFPNSFIAAMPCLVRISYILLQVLHLRDVE